MVESKKSSWIGIALTIISGWKELVASANSVLEGFKDIWNTFPPVMLGLIMRLFLWIGNEK